MVLAPQLRQSLKILQVPTLELRSVILEELQNNPTLEELTGDDISIEAEQDKHEAPDPAESFEEESKGEPEAPEYSTAGSESSEHLDFKEDFASVERMGEDWSLNMYEESGEIPYTSEAEKKRQHFFDSLTGDTSLQEHLLDQARMSDLSPEAMEAFEYLVGSLDERGFLTSKPGDIALMTRIPLRVVQEALRHLQSLEPPGIGARDVQECLLLQLRNLGQGSSVAARMIEKQWNLLIRRRLPELARKLGVSIEEIQNAQELIASLDPAPGRRFSEDQNRIVQADVTVYQDEGGEWQIELNNEYVPRLRLNQDYKHLLARGQLKGKDKEYVQDKFRNGRFLINAIEQRQITIEKITRKILEYQEDFFEKGKSYLKPLTMNQIAEQVGVHETTVSRAIANKYIQTPQGLLEMKYFFNTGYESTDGTSVSNKSVKERIARIIENEPPSKPYSDQKVVEILKEDGVKIARRTVAKYREELGILPTNLRRQYA